MICDYCKQEGATAYYVDSGSQPGIKYVCDKEECQNKFFNLEIERLPNKEEPKEVVTGWQVITPTEPLTEKEYFNQND